jgi:Sulfatase
VVLNLVLIGVPIGSSGAGALHRRLDAGSLSRDEVQDVMSYRGMTRTSRTGILSPGARRLAARMMEVFAGFLSHTDHHIGRLLDFLKETGEFHNTLIMVVSDNGASAEGGPTGTTNELQFFNNVLPIDGSAYERFMAERP